MAGLRRNKSGLSGEGWAGGRDLRDFDHLVFDVDGTLVTGKKKISPALRACLRDLQAQGRKVYLCTGRTVDGVLAYARDLEMEKYGGVLIGMNGSLVQRMDGKVLLDPEVLDRERLWPLLAAFDGLDLLTLAFYRNDMACAVNRAGLELFELAASKFPRFNRLPMNICRSYKDFREEAPLKVLFMGRPEALSKARAEILAPYREDYALVDSADFFLELMPKGTNKGRGLARLFEKEKTDPQRVMAFGDQNNDLEMIEMAGLGLAMGNASERLKDAADLVIGTNEEDGICRFLIEAGLWDPRPELRALLLPPALEKCLDEFPAGLF